MPRVLLIADDKAHWPADVGPSVTVLASHDLLRPHLNCLAEFHRLFEQIRPEVLHADGPHAVCATYWLSKLPWTRSQPVQVVSGVSRSENWFVRRALLAARRVIARNSLEATQYTALGVVPERITHIPYGIVASPDLDPLAFRRSLNIPETSRLVMARGFLNGKTAVWAFDILKYAVPDLYLVLIGDGPECDRWLHFAQALGFDDFRVRQTDARPGLAALFGLAEVVWITQEHDGVDLALAALASGRPVVAGTNPELDAILISGVTGRRVVGQEPVSFAEATLALMDDPHRAQALGQAGRNAVRERFPQSEVGKLLADVYRGTTE